MKDIPQEKRATHVLDSVRDGTMFGQSGKKACKKFVTKECRKEMSGWKLCAKKDTCHQGCVNLQGIEAVRTVQDLKKVNAA